MSFQAPSIPPCLTPGSAHQPAASRVYRAHPRSGYKEIDLDLTPACPETGYRWGSAWLYKALPQDVIGWVAYRFELTVPS